MALTTEQTVWARRQVAADVLGGAPASVTKAQIDTAVAACVTWIETNSASAVAAMSGTALAGASDAVKAEVLALAITARYGGVA